uniref:Uncharacterized protein n=1 Tax=Candidatus Methanogaster sp. ANME-2c ERB4 TaxID=2759911 RepID=A0A7G9YI41_9EURY|nr:hypothetical protein FJIOJMEM_00001 [Methanosarcinales archaeon ANME-2c ERB4]
MERKTSDECLILVDSEIDGFRSVIDLIEILVLTAITTLVLSAFHTHNLIEIDFTRLNMKINNLDCICGVQMFNVHLHAVAPFHNVFIEIDHCLVPIDIVHCPAQFPIRIVRMRSCHPYHPCQHHGNQYQPV